MKRLPTLEKALTDGEVSWTKARVVYQEILKLTPNYKNAQTKLAAIRQREANAEVASMRVQANKGWQKTGVKAIRGRPIQIRAEGRWTYQLKVPLGPDGIKIPKELQEFNLGSLVGVIDTGNSEELEPFVVGAETSFTAQRTGQLYLRMYDVDPSDNEGALEVQIRGTFDRVK